MISQDFEIFDLKIFNDFSFSHGVVPDQTVGPRTFLEIKSSVPFLQNLILKCLDQFLVCFQAPRWLKKKQPQSRPKRSSLSDFCRSYGGSSCAWNFKLLVTKPCYLVVKLSFRYHLMVKIPWGWLSGPKNVPGDLQLEKSWNFLWNHDFAWISLILNDFGGILWISRDLMNFEESFEGFR